MHVCTHAGVSTASRHMVHTRAWEHEHVCQLCVYVSSCTHEHTGVGICPRASVSAHVGPSTCEHV